MAFCKLLGRLKLLGKVKDTLAKSTSHLNPGGGPCFSLGSTFHMLHRPWAGYPLLSSILNLACQRMFLVCLTLISLSGFDVQNHLEHKVVPESISSKFDTVNAIHNRNTQSASRNDIYIPKCKSTLAQQNFMVRGPRLWGGPTPLDIRKIAADKADFKQTLFAYILTQQGNGS